MNHRFARLVLSPLLALSLIAGPGAANARIRNVTDPDAPRSLPEAGPVSVRWNDPAQFSEIRRSMSPVESRRGTWVEQLAQHLRKRAQPRLPAGERLEVTFTDIDLAGDFEPWHDVQFQDTRVIRDIYPPRIELSFRRLDANGAVVAEGERKLTDGGFLFRSSVAGSEPLRFEKELIDRWLARELLASPALGRK